MTENSKEEYLTAEARSTQSKEFLNKKYSNLCELGVSVVKFFDQLWREKP